MNYFTNKGQELAIKKARVVTQYEEDTGRTGTKVWDDQDNEITHSIPKEIWEDGHTEIIDMI